MSHLGEFEQLILFSILRLGDGAYGLAIRDSIVERTGRAASPGAIYTTLGRLEERGLVHSRVADPPEGGRRRKCYVLNRRGARALRDAYDASRAAADGLLDELAELAGG